MEGMQNSAAEHKAAQPRTETLESVMEATGFDRWERLARWLGTATAGELEALAVVWQEGGAYEDRLTGDALFLRWTEIDAAGALAWSRKHGTHNWVWWAWGKNDPEAALAAALKEKETWCGTCVMRAIGQSHPERARGLLAKYPQFSNAESLEGLASGLSRNDPRAGAELALTFSRTKDPDAVETFARREPDAALKWAKEIAEPAARSRALKAIIAQWEQSAPERIGPAIQSLPAGKSKNRFIEEHAARLARTDPDPALTWAQQAELPAVQQAATAAVATALAQSDPARALEALRTLDWKNDGDSVTGANFASFPALKALGQTAPKQAMAFAESLSGENRKNARDCVFNGWLKTKPEEASGWLAAQPPEQRQGTQVDMLINHLSNGPEPDFDAAMQWAASTGEQLNSRLQQVFRQWYQTDPNAAAQALQQPGVPEDVARAILPQLYPKNP